MALGVLALTCKVGRLRSRWLLLVRHDLLEHHLVELVDVLHDRFSGFLESDAVPHNHGQLPACPLLVERELLPLFRALAIIQWHRCGRASLPQRINTIAERMLLVPSRTAKRLLGFHTGSSAVTISWSSLNVRV